ncbi:MAG TPA: superoxide dismutase [Anaerolineaceae bacterium]|nr:superoxide dismutase [Anaerolineaceae bacterium]
MTTLKLPEKQPWMKTAVELPELPWAKNALEPVISANTIDFHYGKHHNAYVLKTLELTKGTELEGQPLEMIMVVAAADPSKKGLYNNAAQVWNHSFYWKCLAPCGTVKPSDALKAKIEKDFGSWEEFRKQLIAAGMTQFGSGWAWVVIDGDKLSILKTPNADEPWGETQAPVLALDVWEHAYYLDYQNKRQAYLEAVIDNLINWDFVEKQIGLHKS